MKNKILLNISLLFILSAVILLNSCEIKDPTEGIEVRVKNIARTTTVRVEFIDGNSLRPIGEGTNTKVDVFFEGKNKSDIITDVNEPISKISTKNGVIYFAIRDDLKPSIQNPIEVLLICSANNYLTTSARFLINDDGVHGYNVKMVNLASTPEGVSSNHEQEGNTGTEGTDQDIQVSSGGNETEPKAVINVSPGTKMKDESGNILTGKVRTRVTYFSPSEASSVESFPGGFSVSTDNQGDGFFITAGFVAIDMDVDGVPVESFEGGNVDVSIDIPSDLTNPNTGQPIQPGEVIPLWSYDEKTGKWNFERNITIPLTKASQNGKINVKIDNIKHLSWWNLDWWWDSCDEGIKIHLTGNFSTAYLAAYRADNGSEIGGFGQVFSSDPYVQLVNIPPNIPVIIKAYASITDYLIDSAPLGTLSLNNLCEQTTVDFAFNGPTGEIPIDVYVKGICPNGNVLDQGTLNVEVFKDDSWQLAGTIINGYIRLNLVLNQPYNFRVFYDGEYYEQTHTATNTFEFVEIQLGNEVELCD